MDPESVKLGLFEDPKSESESTNSKKLELESTYFQNFIMGIAVGIGVGEVVFWEN